MEACSSDVWAGAQRWTTVLCTHQAEEQDLSTFSRDDLKMLSSHQRVEFLSLLLQEVRAASTCMSSSGPLSSLGPVCPPGAPSSDSREEDAGGV